MTYYLKTAEKDYENFKKIEEILDNSWEHIGDIWENVKKILGIFSFFN